MADAGGSDNSQLVKLLALGGAAFVGYKFVYQPWEMRQKLQAEIEAQTRANLAKGMGIEEAGQKAISAACQAVAAFYKVPPSTSGGVCAGVGILAEKGIKALGKGAIIAGKVIGHEAAVVGRGIGKGAKAVGHTAAVIGRGVGKGASTIGKVVKFTHYTAPKKVVTTAAKVVKFASYTAPKKVVTTVAKDVGKGAKAVAKSISHGFGLWGLAEAAAPRPRRALRPVNPFAEHARRQMRADLPGERKRRSQTPAPGGGRPRRTMKGAAFYTRHLR
ncbi:MAG TPA: hypothetical protein VFQ87_03205 [Bradyrhizobium sp.]|jgi:hypothetical protein|nr:hypothetical protein [Bradyrhizobium sp.]